MGGSNEKSKTGDFGGEEKLNEGVDCVKLPSPSAVRGAGGKE